MKHPRSSGSESDSDAATWFLREKTGDADRFGWNGRGTSQTWWLWGNAWWEIGTDHGWPETHEFKAPIARPSKYLWYIYQKWCFTTCVWYFLPICVLGYLEVPGISVSLFPSLIMSHLPVSLDMAMDQYLLIPFLMGWTSIYQLFWCSPYCLDNLLGLCQLLWRPLGCVNKFGAPKSNG